MKAINRKVNSTMQETDVGRRICVRYLTVWRESENSPEQKTIRTASFGESPAVPQLGSHVVDSLMMNAFCLDKHDQCPKSSENKRGYPTGLLC